MKLLEWQNTEKHTSSLIVQASPTDESDTFQPFPIGMSFEYLYHYKKGISLQIGDHKNTVLCAISTHTDKKRRPTGINRENIVNTLKLNNITNIKTKSYFDILPTYKFVISPEGNGIDCHRHYEALLAGCIPIVEYNEQIIKKYKGCPILYTNDYSEINETYLLEQYSQMINKDYDFSRLFLDYYSTSDITEIKKCGNYWTKRIFKWYT